MTQKRTKAVLYARVSSKEQEKGFSIPAQVKLLHGYAAEQGFSIAEEFVDVETAKRAGRTGFGEMLRFLKRSRCRTVLVEKTDRLYRNLKDWVTLDELDLELHFVKENVVLSPDARSSEKFMHGIKVLMAKNYIDNLSEETRKGMKEKAEQGIWPSFAPLGYINVECGGRRLIQADPKLAPLIEKLFGWYATGNYSLKELVTKAHEEGLTYRKSGDKIPKSMVHKILTNPIFYGDFDWDGVRYRGTHDPIVSKGVFDTVQDILSDKGKRRTGRQKHDWAFRGLVSCGHCGCALVAEIKKHKYIYYHCTGNKGKCPERYVREEVLAERFGDALKAIRIDSDVLDWVVKALRESHTDERRYHEERIKALQTQYTKLQGRIDAMYVDKLDGTIDGAFFERKAAEWRTEQTDLLRRVEHHQSANSAYLDEGVQLLELAGKAWELYQRQPMAEKRRLLNYVCSNSIWMNGQLIPTYRKPFDLLAEMPVEEKTKKAALQVKGDLFEKWLPSVDSNHGQAD